MNSGNLFLADIHALTTQPDKKVFKEICKELLCVLFSLTEGTNIKIYRQSKIPSIFVLSAILNNFCSKGFLNRCHSYKILAQENIKQGKDVDYHIFNGLYSYPVLMSADILISKKDILPIGSDQIQHIEIMKDIVKRFNNHYNKEILKCPENIVVYNTKVIGTDGRKMSKSYNNILSPFYLTKPDIFKIKTNCKQEGELKLEDDSILYPMFKSIVSKELSNQLLKKMNNGESWKDLKEFVFKNLHNIIKEETRELFFYYKEHFDELIIKKLEDNEEEINEEYNRNLDYIMAEINL